MSETTHTPTPWEVKECADGMLVVGRPTHVPVSTMRGPGIAEAAANAMRLRRERECAECPLSDAFDGLSDDLCCEIDPTTPRCESCGVPFVKHLGLAGTCAEKERYLSLLRRVLMGKGAVSADDWERMGYPDVAEFLRDDEKRT